MQVEPTSGAALLASSTASPAEPQPALTGENPAAAASTNALFNQVAQQQMDMGAGTFGLPLLNGESMRSFKSWMDDQKDYQARNRKINADMKSRKADSSEDGAGANLISELPEHKGPAGEVLEPLAKKARGPEDAMEAALRNAQLNYTTYLISTITGRLAKDVEALIKGQ